MSRATRTAARIAICMAAAGCASPAAFAAHPLETEDTGTQGSGNVEFENGLSWTRADGSKLFVYQPQISVGVTPAVDLIVQPSWLRSASAGEPTVHGMGDTNLDVKWRFFGSAPWSFGVRAGAQLPTAQHDLGLPHGDVATHALLVATFDAAPFTVHANAGMIMNPATSGERTRMAQVSSAVMWQLDEQWILTADIDGGSNPDPGSSQWPVTLLAGAIYTVHPGLDVDVGYQGSLHASPASTQWLVGLTYRFAP